MHDLREKLNRFLRGRYGMDALGKGLVTAYLVLSVFNVFLRSALVYGLASAVLVVWLLRVLSRNHAARAKENRTYTEFIERAKRWVRMHKNMWRDRKTHVYRECPGCGVVVRLPRKTGEHVCCCPKCKTKFSVMVR